MAKDTVLIGVGGGVAAYKSVALASALTKAGCRTVVAMTPAAQAFVGEVSFAAVTNERVLTTIFPAHPGQRDEIYPHLYPATEAAAMVVAPATANLIARIAHGFGDDIVSSSALSLRQDCRRFFCPAMNVDMWQQPTVAANVEALTRLGWQRLGPGSGHLACGASGAGRMCEPEEIAAAVLASLQAGALSGRTIVIVSGPTREHFDPVRYISNASSGRMGRELGLAAARQGATVQFVTGPVASEELPRHPRVTVHQVTSAEEMLAAAQAQFAAADAVIYVAAVADYRPQSGVDRKLPKSEVDLQVQLEPTPDIAATISAAKRPGQICLGFALETHDGEAKARAKLARKHLDGIVLNDTDSMGASDGNFRLLRPDRELEAWGRIGKTTCAERLIATLVELLA